MKKLLALITIACLSTAGIIGYNLPDKHSYDFEPDHSNLFEIEPMFLGCMRWDVQSNDKIIGFTFKQPLVLNIVNVHDVTIKNVSWYPPIDLGTFCYANDKPIRTVGADNG